MNTLATCLVSECPAELPGGRLAVGGPLLAIGAALLLSACSSGDVGSGGAVAGATVTRGVFDDRNGASVSGRTIDLAGAEIVVDECSGSATDLQDGMRVTVESDGGQVVRVSYDEDVKGPVDDVAFDGTITVMGQRVRTTATTVFNDIDGGSIAVGDVLEVSGLRESDGTLVASYLEHKRSLPEAYELRGLVRDLDVTAQVFTVGSLTVAFASAEFDDSNGSVLRNGAEVEIKQRPPVYEPGSLNLVATRIEPYGLPFAGTTNGSAGDGASALPVEYEIEGVITEVLPNDRVALGGLIVAVAPGTGFRDGTLANLVVGQRVEVEGQLDAAGVLVAWDIEFEDGDSHDHHDARRPGSEDDGDDSDDDRGGDDSDDGDDSRIEIEGTVSTVETAAGIIGLGGMRVVVSGSTQFRDGADRAISRDAFFALLVPDVTVVKVEWRGADGQAGAPHEVEIEN